MSRQVDERVVSMQFDNKQFEANVKTTMSTLEKFSNSLKFKGATSGLENLNTSASKVDMSPLARGVEAVHSRFSALEVMAVTALANITNSAVNAGKRIASALTIEPVFSGFSEYETQINSVQTILANTSSKGSTLQDVNRALDELNLYADKTIYNFTEMTRNIGTFTAAGVDLDTSVQAIKGIANLAAVSGSTSQQASTAMYQLSQALASGTVKLMDWNSVVNAGMGGQVFQDSLKETARVHGVSIDSMIKKEGSFRETLKSGWLTSEILTETLEKFTGDLSESQLKQKGYTEDQIAEIMKLGKTANDAATKVKTFTQLFDTMKEAVQSGWTQSWEIIIGDFDEAKELLTEISDVFGGFINTTAESRNNMLSEGLSSGWKQLLNAGISDEQGYIEALKGIAGEQGDAFEKMIKDEGSFEKALKKGLGDGTITTDMMSGAVTKLADNIRKMSVEEREAAGYTEEHLIQIEALEAGIKDGTVSMEEFSKKIQAASGRENIIQALRNAMKGLLSVIKPVSEAFQEIFPAITGKQLYSFTETLVKFTEKLTLSDTASKNLKDTFKGLFAVVSIIGKVFTAVIKAISSLFGVVSDAGGGILSITGFIGRWLVALNDLIGTTNIFNTVFGGIANVIKTVASAIIGLITSIFEPLQKRMDQVGDTADNMKNKMVSAFEETTSSSRLLQNLSKIWTGITKVIEGIINAFVKLSGSLASSIGDADFSGFIDLINSLAYGGIAIGITKFVKIFRDQIESIGNVKESFVGILDGVRGCFEAYQSQLKAGTLLKIASAIAILAVSLIILSAIDSVKLATAIGAITLLFTELMTSMAIFNRISGKTSGAFKTVTVMIGISMAVLILASALKKIGNLDIKQMSVGVLGIAGLAAIIVTAAKIMGKGSSTIIKGAAQMVIFALAIKILASACEDLSTLSWTGMAKGLVGVGALMAGISIFLRTAKFGGKAISTALGIVLLASAMKILASVVQDFSGLSWGEMAKGMVALAGALTIITIAMKAMPKNMISIGAGLLIVSASLLVVANVLDKLSGMSWEGIAKGMVAIGGAMLIMAIGLHAMNGTLVGSAAMLVAASALMILTPVLAILGAMSWMSIVKGLTALAGAFIVIGLAGLILKPLIGTILGLSVSIALIGVAVLAVGVGLVAAGAGLSAIAVGITALVAALAGGAKVIVDSLAEIMIVISTITITIATAIAKAIIEFCKIIAEGAGEIGESIKVIVLTLIDVLMECVPALVNAAFKMVIAVLDGLNTHMPDLIKAAVNVLSSLFSGVANALKSIDTKTLFNGIVGVGLLTAIMYALSAVVKLIPKAMIGALGIGVVLLELAGIFWILSKLNIDMSIGSMLAMSTMLIVMTGVLTVLSGIGSSALGAFAGIAALAVLGLVVAEIGVILGLMSKYNLQASIKNVAAISLMLITMTGVLVVLTLLGPLASGAFVGIGALAVLGLVVVEIALILGVMSALNIEASMNNVVALSTMLIVMTGVLAVLCVLGPFAGGALMGIGALAVLGLVVAEIALILGVMSKMNIEASMNNVVALSTMLIVMTGVLAVLCLLGPFAAGALIGIGALGLLGLVVAEIAIILGVLTKLDITPSMELINNLTTMLINMTKVLAVLSVIGLLGPAAYIGVGALMTLITAIGGLLVAIGALTDKFPKLEEFLNTGIPILEKIGYALGSFFGNIIGGFMTGATSGLPDVGAKLGEFMTNAMPFINGIKMVDDSVLNGVSTLTKAIILLSAADLIEGISSFVNGGTSFATLGTELSTFMTNAKPFIEGSKSVDPAIMQGVKALAETILILTSADLIEGLTSWFTGGTSFESFGKEITTLAPYIKQYSDSVVGIDGAAVQASATAAKSLAEVFSIISGVDTSEDSTTLTAFGTQIASFGWSLKLYSLCVTGIDYEAISASVKATKELAEMNEAIPNLGGMVSWFTGDNDLATFGAKLVSYGQSLVLYANAVSGIESWDGINSSVEATKKLAEMNEAVPNIGGMVSWFTGDNSLASFGTTLAAYGESLVSYIESVSGIESYEGLNNSVEATKKLAEMNEAVPKVGGMVSWFTGDKSLSTFGSKLLEYGKKLKEYAEEMTGFNITSVNNTVNITNRLINMIESMKDIDTGGIQTFKNALSSLAEIKVKDVVDAFNIEAEKLVNVGADLIDSIIEGLKSKESALSDTVNKLTSVMTSCIEDNKDKFKVYGIEIMSLFINGISSHSNRAKRVIKSVVSGVLSNIRGYYKQFKTAGAYLVDGFAAGISANTYKAKAKARAMASAAAEAAKKELDEHSPSKVGYEIGDFFGLAFVTAIGDYVKTAYNTSSEMAVSAKKGLSETVARINNILNSDIDGQPVIRPVVDLSNVASSASAINGMFNVNPSLETVSSLNRIGNMMNARRSADDGIVSAIENLSRKLNNMSGNTYNINGVTYDDGTNVSSAVESLIRAARIERRI